PRRPPGGPGSAPPGFGGPALVYIRGDTDRATAAVVRRARPAVLAPVAVSHENVPLSPGFADAVIRSSAPRCLAASTTPSAKSLPSAHLRSTTAYHDP